MARMISGPRKRRTREHIIADLSINYFERQVLLTGHTAERIVHDYGLDMVVLTYFDAGEPEAGLIYAQVKATDQLELVGNGRFVSCRIERAHLRGWLPETFPVILIVYDAIHDRAWWLYIQAAFTGTPLSRSARFGRVEGANSCNQPTRSRGRSPFPALSRADSGPDARSRSS